MKIPQKAIKDSFELDLYLRMGAAAVALGRLAQSHPDFEITFRNGLFETNDGSSTGTRGMQPTVDNWERLVEWVAQS